MESASKKTKKNTKGILLLCISVVLLLPAASAVPEIFNVQGRLTDDDNTVVTGSYDFDFYIYSALTDGTLLWSEAHDDQAVINGLFNVIIGDVNTAKTFNQIDFNTAKWLEIEVEGETQSPRLKMASIGTAMRAQIANDLNSTGDANTVNLGVSGNTFLNNLFATGDSIFNSNVTIEGDLNVGGNIFSSTGDINFVGDANFSADVNFQNIGVSEGTYLNWLHGTGDFNFYNGTNNCFYDISNGSFACGGEGVSASGAKSVAFGQLSQAQSAYSAALWGFGSIASADYAMVGGNACEASQNYAIAMGTYAIASGEGSVALGTSVDATANFATAIGYGVYNEHTQTVALGIDANVQRNLWVGGDLNVAGDLNVLGDINFGGRLVIEGVTFSEGGIIVTGDSNLANLQATNFFGDGSGLTGVTSTADINGEDVVLNWVDIDGNLSVAGDANFVDIGFSGLLFGDGSKLTGVTAIADVNGEDVVLNWVDIDGNLSVAGDSNLTNTSFSNIFGGNYFGLWTEGSILFTGADGNIYQKNSNLYWSDSNNRLGIGMNTGFDTNYPGLSVTGDIDLMHTAIANDDHALDMDVDAAGFGDVKAIDIGFVTGAISTGENEGVILINIDESAATGGSVIGVEVLATEGAAKIYGLEAGVLVNPVTQLSGVFGDMDSAEVKGVDKLAEFTSTVSDTIIFASDDDNITIGNAAKFEEIEFLLDTVANPGIAPIFEFSTGVGAWTTFSPTDGTNELKHNGVVAWQDEDIPTWAVGAGNEYIIRITRTKNNLVSTPKEDKVQISSATKYQWDRDGDLGVRDVNVGRTLRISGTDLNEGYWSKFDSDLNNFYCLYSDQNKASRLDYTVLADLNDHFTPYIGGIYDLNLGENAIKAFGASYFGAVTATSFTGAHVGDGSGLTGVSADMNGEDVRVNILGVDSNASFLDDVNALRIQATDLFGNIDWTFVQNETWISDYLISTLDVNTAANTSWLGKVQTHTADVNVSSGVNTGIGIDADMNRVCFPSNSCEMYIDYNGTAFVFGG